MATMRAVVRRDYGPPDVLTVEDVERPVVDEGGVLIRVHAASINPLDWHIVTGQPRLMRLMSGMPRPRAVTPGSDLAGTVVEVGPKVTTFRPGDEVFGGILGARSGSLAEYACAPEGSIVTKPPGVTFEQAATIPVAGLTALQAVRRGNLRAGQRVLINGAAGGVGTFAVQIAKHAGAHATGVCSTANVERVRGLGADHVVDYMREDFLRSGERFDLMIDNVANRSPWKCRDVLTRTGIYVAVTMPKSFIRGLGHMLGMIGAFAFASQRGAPLIATPNAQDLTALAELIAARKVTPVIDRVYALTEAAEAFRHLGTGHARGKIVITM